MSRRQETTLDILNEMFRDMQLARVRDLHGEADFDNIITLAEARYRAVKRHEREDA